MNKAEFYKSLRRRESGVFGTSLSQRQVEGCEALLGAAQGLQLAHVAYILATAYHETGGKMFPNRENLNYTTAARLCAVWPSRFKTIASAKPFVRSPKNLANKVYNGRLGNVSGSNDGWNYRGGGFDHLTGRDNYRRASHVVGVDLVAHPERILDPKIAAECIVSGMVSGRYRGKKLSDFTTYEPMRAIINADVAANGKRVAHYANAFKAALISGGWSSAPLVASAPKPKTRVAKGGGLSAIIKAILRMFK